MCGPHANFVFGWGLILLAFVTGAGLGLFFHRDDFQGGYASFQRRIVRLGHIALAAIGVLNVLYGISPVSNAPPLSQNIASIGLIIGGVAMPAVCFLTGWRSGFRRLFSIPVLSLIVAVASILYGALL
jgi:hypothetical protein